MVGEEFNPENISSQPVSKSNNFLKFAIIGIIIVIVIIGIVIGYLYFSSDKEDLEESNQGDEGVFDCGEEMECFEEKFAECEPVTLTSKLTNTIIYYYEILGPKNNLCEIKSKYTANPNPDWVEKEMICLYDNSKEFETATAEVINSFNTEQHLGSCEGELYDLMINL